MQKLSLQRTSSLFATRHLLTAGGLSLGYLLLSVLLIGLQNEQLWLVLLFNACYFISAGTRKLITGFSVFIVFWIIFDYMKAFPNYRYQPVHIESLYRTEKAWFGIKQHGIVLTPNEYWLSHGNNWLDVMAGIFYLCWVPVPLAFAGFLFFKNRKIFLRFSLTFLLVNLIGFAIYYIYPAAPPWYVQLHGFDFDAATPGNTAGLARFDAFFHAGIFKSLYAKSSNVFAAVPSLHASYPMVVLFFGWKHHFGRANLFFLLVMGGIWFSAVYTSHHYVLDILAGIACAAAGIFLFQWLVTKNTSVKKWVMLFDRAIQ
ncbi:MAG: phosphatase PAP2 family protein [Sediminibacterium sp.]